MLHLDCIGHIFKYVGNGTILINLLCLSKSFKNYIDKNQIQSNIIFTYKFQKIPKFVKKLIIWQVKITDDHCKQFQNLEYLVISDPYNSITDQAFIYLKHLKGLEIHDVNVTENIFTYLPNLDSLSVGYCKYLKQNILKYLKNIIRLRILDINDYDEPIKLKSLDITHKTACNLINSRFSYLKNIKKLNIYNYSLLTDNVFDNMSTLETLEIGGTFMYLTPKIFKKLKNLRSLSIVDCDSNVPKYFLQKSFKYLRNLKILNIMQNQKQFINNKMFKYLKNLIKFNMAFCNHNTLTDEIFKYLPNLEYLDIRKCNSNTITNNIFKYLPKLKTLFIQESERDLLKKELLNKIDHVYVENLDDWALLFDCK